MRCLPREHWITGPVLAKEALKALPKTAVAVPSKRTLKKFLQWEKHKQGELEVLAKRVLMYFQSMPDNAIYRISRNQRKLAC